MKGWLGSLDEGLVAAIGLVDIGLVGDLPQGVHGQDGNAGVDDVHAVLGHDVGDGAAATRAAFRANQNTNCILYFCGAPRCARELMNFAIPSTPIVR